MLAACTGSGGQALDENGNLLPTARLEVYNAAGAAPLPVGLDASASVSSFGIQSYDYDVDGDGTYDRLDAGNHIDHTYTAAGEYTAKVRVTDKNNNTATATAEITVTAGGGVDGGGDDGGGDTEVDPPSLKLGYYPTALHAEETVNLDASNSWSQDGSALTFDYDFDGDGTFDELNAGNAVTHVYQQAGTYNVVVRAKDGAGRTTTATIAVTVAAALPNQLPIAQLTADPASGEPPLTVEFTATTSYDTDGTIESYDWDFGDTTTMANGGPTVQHQYTAPGTYTARVSITDNRGGQASATVTVTVTPPLGALIPPEAKLSAVPTTGTLPLAVNFDASASVDADGTISQYRFDYDGDGVADLLSTLPLATHIYLAAGNYNATVTVEDNTGLTDTAVVAVAVSGGSGGTGQPPVIMLSASTYLGDAPLTVTFDAGFSLDIDGTIVRFDWDLDNDGNWEVIDGGDAQTVTFNAADFYTVNCRAEDDSGLTTTASVYVFVN